MFSILKLIGLVSSPTIEFKLINPILDDWIEIFWITELTAESRSIVFIITLIPFV